MRDLDVQLLGWDELIAPLASERAAELEPLRKLLERRRAREFARLRRSLRRRALRGRARRLARARDDRARRRPRGRTPTVAIDVLAADRIRRVYRRMVRDGSEIGDDSPPEALHDLRKRGKELRYLLEMFGGLFEPKVVKPMVKTLKQLQDVLGDFQDHAVQSELLRDLRDELAAEPGGPAALIALGAVLDALAAAQQDARDHFAGRFAPLRRGRPAGARARHLPEAGDSEDRRHLLDQGRRGEDLGGRQPRHAGRPRRAAHADLGPRPAGRRLVPVPHQAEGQGRRRRG